MQATSPLFYLRVLRSALGERLDLVATLRHADEALRRTALPILVVVAPMGAVIAMQGTGIFAAFGARSLIGSMLTSSVVVEVAPGLVALLLATQVGSAYAAELGAMTVCQEVAYQEAIGLDPLARLVVPRVAGTVLAAPALGLLAGACGVGCGMLTARMLSGVPAAAFLADVQAHVCMRDVWIGVAKTALFAAIVGLVACRSGLATVGGAAETGASAHRAVVKGILVCVLANWVVATALLQSGALR